MSASVTQGATGLKARGIVIALGMGDRGDRRRALRGSRIRSALTEALAMAAHVRLSQPAPGRKAPSSTSTAKPSDDSDLRSSEPIPVMITSFVNRCLPNSVRNSLCLQQYRQIIFVVESLDKAMYRFIRQYTCSNGLGNGVFR